MSLSAAKIGHFSLRLVIRLSYFFCLDLSFCSFCTYTLLILFGCLASCFCSVLYLFVLSFPCGIPSVVATYISFFTYHHAVDGCNNIVLPSFCCCTVVSLVLFCLFRFVHYLCLVVCFPSLVSVLLLYSMLHSLISMAQCHFCFV